MNHKIFELHAQICQTFTSPKRLEIIYALCDGEKTVSELAPLLGIRQANLSQHLAILRQRKIVVTRREGVNVYYRIANPKILQACDIMREVLLEQIAEDEKLVRIIREKGKALAKKPRGKFKNNQWVGTNTIKNALEVEKVARKI